MNFWHEVVIVRGNAKLKPDKNTHLRFRAPDGQWVELAFRKSFVLESLGVGETLQNCTYRIHRREFTDLSFVHGETGEKWPRNFEIRKHKDGTKFLFAYESTPTFDFEDRLWSGMVHTAVYRDKRGINLISCHHGTYVSEIHIYLGLKNLMPEDASWLKALNGR